MTAAEMAVSRRREQFAGTVTLTRLLLRRDRWRILLWIVGLGLASVATGSSFAGLYVTEVERATIAATMESPAMVAMSGVNHGAADYHIGAMLAHQMLWFTLVLTALMAVFLAVRSTRLEEATGRAELVRAAVVGRHAPLAAAMLAVAIASTAIAACTAVTLGASGFDGIDWPGSWLYGATHVMAGIVFGGIAILTAQITEHPRGAVGLGIAAVGAAYVVRAVGDMTATGLSWLSPIGWAQATRVYVDNRWWPMLIGVAAAGAAVAVAAVLASRRDVGAGLRRPRPGPASAGRSLRTPLGVAFRLHRAASIGWIAGLALLGMIYGSVLGETETMIESIDALGEFLETSGGVDVTVAFASMITAVMAIIASIAVVLAVLRIRHEESAGRAEPLLATAVSRVRWFGGHLLVATALGAVAVAGAALSLGVVGAVSIGDDGLVGDAARAAGAYIPAVWVTMGVAAVLVGWAPRFAHAAWVVVVAAFVDVYLGGLLQLPEWTAWLSPFGLVPQIPLEPFSAATGVTMVAVAIVLAAVGVVGFVRRDLQSTT
ncbi:MAG: hypothetical protein WD377_06755 [Nitriliruptoraceae bacterium]